MTVLSPGLHQIDGTTYHADTLTDQPTLSKSIMHELLSASPLHAWTAHPRLNPNFSRSDEWKFDLGTAAHALFFEGDAGVQVCHYKDWKKGDAQAERDSARAEGKIPMLPHQWDACQAMVAAMRSQLEALDLDPPLFTDGKCEQTLVWNESSVACRARLDWLRDDYRAIDDLKTSHSSNPDNWTRRTLFDIGADLQAVFYARGLKAVTGRDAEFRFVVIETKPPFELIVVSLEPEARAFAEQKVDKALALWKRCLDTDTWPGYPKDICYATLPGWLESQWLEKDAREEQAA